MLLVLFVFLRTFLGCFCACFFVLAFITIYFLVHGFVLVFFTFFFIFGTCIFSMPLSSLCFLLFLEFVGSRLHVVSCGKIIKSGVSFESLGFGVKSGNGNGNGEPLQILQCVAC